MLDIFSGSNTTGQVAQEEGRRWISCELVPEFARLSAVRFMDAWPEEDIRAALEALDAGKAVPIESWRATDTVKHAELVASA